MRSSEDKSTRRKARSGSDRHQRTLLLWGLGLAILAGLLGGVKMQPGVFNHLGNILFDHYQRIQPRSEAGAPVTIVNINAASLHRIGQWPWPRTTIAKLVNQLGHMGAAAIVFDMVFPQPDRTSPSRVLKRLRHLPMAAQARKSICPPTAVACVTCRYSASRHPASVFSRFR